MDWAALQQLTQDIVSEYSSGDDVAIGSDIVSCVEMPMRKSAAAERWGRDMGYTTSVKVVRSNLTAGVPEVRSTVTYQGLTMRIIDIDDARLVDSLVLHLGDSQ